MDIRINPVGFSVNPVLEEFINKKFSKLEKYHDGIMSIDVTLKLEKVRKMISFIVRYDF